VTVADLIRRAFKTMGVLAAEETPSAAEQADALDTLNALLASWEGERLVLFATLQIAFTFTPNHSPHTIGVGGDFDTTRPSRIDRASAMPGDGMTGAEFPIRLISDAEWQNLQGKMSGGMPALLWVETTYPLMKLHFNPIPNATDTLILYTWHQLGRFTSASADFDFPAGYARALAFNLAKELAPEYGVSLSAEAVAIAEESKSTLKRLNERQNYLRCDPAVLQGGFFGLVSGDG